MSGEWSNVRAQAYFLHDRLLPSLLAEDQRDELMGRVRAARQHYSPAAAMAATLEPVVVQLMTSVAELEPLLDSGSLQLGTVVTTTQAFYFKGEGERLYMHGKSAAHPGVELQARISVDRCVGVTGRDKLSRVARVAVLAVVNEVESERVVLEPLFIGRFYTTTDFDIPMGIDDRREVYPSQIQEFSAIRDDRHRLSTSDLALMSKMPENHVKHAFAEILGEPFVMPDWGGERSDLYTSHVHLDGQQVTAAFAFKGPGLRADLYPSNMGANGDQGIRLFFEHADLVVAQHHRRIDSTVSQLLSAFARQFGRRFMLLDGAASAQILKAYGKL